LSTAVKTGPARSIEVSDTCEAINLTAADIEAEHRAALATLTPDQRRALDRLANARQRTNFNGRFPQENLQAIFTAEAQARSRAAA
jgi:hypothetical protein